MGSLLLHNKNESLRRCAETNGSMQKKPAEGNTSSKQTHVRTCVKFNLIIAHMFINLISKKLSPLTLTKNNFYFTHTRISRKQIFLPIRSAALTNSYLWCNVKGLNEVCEFRKSQFKATWLSGVLVLLALNKRCVGVLHDTEKPGRPGAWVRLTGSHLPTEEEEQ